MLLKARLRWGAALAVILCATLAAVWREPEQALRAQLFKQVGNRESIEILSGATIVPGDELYMTVEAQRPLHVYVVSEDAAGERLLIYPCRTWGRSPRLTPGQSYRLPDREGFWPVGSVTPRERLLVIASAHPIDLLDAVFGEEESPLPCAAPIRYEASRWVDGLLNSSERLSFRSLLKAWGRGAETWVSALDLKGIASRG